MIHKNIIAGKEIGEGSNVIHSYNPKTKEKLTPGFTCATNLEIDEAVREAMDAFEEYSSASLNTRADFLRKIADEIEALGEILVEQVMKESGLPAARVKGERGRTCDQLRQFADYVESGEFLQVSIDKDENKDIRKYNIAMGPVAIFTASNFPLAFSTAGGDSASALAAGCPIVVKAHPSHLGTNALVSEAISNAAKKSNVPAGVYSTVIGEVGVGKKLIKHEGIKAIGFTGSFGGGKAIMDVAASRETPIPVYAEMGSINPVIMLESSYSNEKLPSILANSANMGVGQFCTNPGIILLSPGTGRDEFIGKLQEQYNSLQQFTMLNENIYNTFHDKRDEVAQNSEAEVIVKQEQSSDWCASPTLIKVSAGIFLHSDRYKEEIFGPYTLLITCENEDEIEQVVDSLEGQLTGTIWGNDREIESHASQVNKLAEKVGRIIFNDMPTGVAVCKSMHHGGPFPASSNGKYTSVGLDAIYRFLRPVCYQNAPQSLLAEAIKDNNSLNINRVINGKMTKEAL